MKQSTLDEYFPRRKFKQEEEQMEYTMKQLVTAQPFLQRHQQCSSSCLDFQNYAIKGSIIHEQMIKCQPLALYDCVWLIQKILNQNEMNKDQQMIIKKDKKVIKKIRKAPRAKVLSEKQRQQILELKKQRFKTQYIAHILKITPGQVRMNASILNSGKYKKQISITDDQKLWLIDQCQKEQNSVLFNSTRLLKLFSETFDHKELSVYQFRRLLKDLKIVYRVPSLKPLQYFIKKKKNPEVFRFIEEISGYLTNNFQLIFIDECSMGNISRRNHKQWHVLGSFKQSMERIGSNIFIIAAIGQNDFLRYQVIQGLGRAVIFKNFFEQLLQASLHHYGTSKIVFILDNATTHKGQEMQDILEKVPHVFTPPYRPDFNGIEYMFSWIKQYVVKEQPNLIGAFHKTLHQAFEKIDQYLIKQWTNSIFKPILSEIMFLKE